MTTDTALLIRPARLQELGELARLALAAKAFWGYSAAQLAAWQADLSPTEESIRAHPAFVAVWGGLITGFHQLVLSVDEARLECLWVDPTFMRRGIGKALLGHAARLAAEAGFASLEIDSDPYAEPFYTACGAIRVGVVPAPIDDDPQRVRPQMRLALPLA